MKPVRVKKRFFVVRFLRRWLYRLIKEDELVSVSNWQRHVTPCVYCQRPIPVDSLFCAHCGFALATRKPQDTTGHRLPTPPVVPVTLTGQIEAMVNPREKHARLNAYNRLKGQQEV